MPLCYKTMTMEHYDAVHALWSATENVGLSGADERPAIQRYLERNPGASFVCLDGDTLAGAILAGHDGRRGYLNHLAVASACRRRGIGLRLTELALNALRAEGIEKCHLMIFAQNEKGRAFWEKAGFSMREDIRLMSRVLEKQ